MKNLLLSFTILFTSLSAFSQGKWAWQNPTPPNNGLHNVQVIDANNYYMGSTWNNVVFKTADAGNNFSILGNNTGSTPADGFHFLNANIGFLAGEKGKLLKTTDGGATFTRLSLPNADFSSKQMYFLSSTTGFISCKDNANEKAILLKTTNAGLNFTEISRPLMENDFSMKAFDENNISIFGYDHSYNEMYIITTNAGANWVATTTTGRGFNYQKSPDVNISLGANASDTLYISTSTGSNYKPIKINCQELITEEGYIGAIDFVSSTTGFLITSFPAFCYKTTDGGMTWTNRSGMITVAGANPLFLWNYKLDFLDENIGIAVGSGRVMLKTTDGGVTWNSMRKTISSQELNSVDYFTASSSVAVGNSGTMLITTNLGGNWGGLPTPTTQNLNGIKIINNHIHIVGNAGIYAKSIDKGASWVTSTLAGGVRLTAVDFINSTLGIAVGNNGVVLRTIDGGGTWVALPTVTSQNLKKVQFACTNKIFAIGDSGTIIKSDSAGRKWFEVTTLGTDKNLKGLYVRGVDTAWVCGESGKIYKTINGGLSWVEQFILGSETNLAISFRDAKNGYVLGEYREQYKTSNGGEDWTKSTDIQAYDDANDIKFFDNNTGIAVGWGGSIINYTNNEPLVSLKTYTCEFITPSVTGLNYSQEVGKLNVYPNPAANVVTFDIDESNFELILYSMQGTVAYSSKNEKTIDISSLNTGLYSYAIVSTAGRIYKGKLSIVK